MFPYIKLTLYNGGEMWIHHETITQVYYDENDGTTTISTSTGDDDFSIREGVKEVVNKLRAFYNEPDRYQSSLESSLAKEVIPNPNLFSW